jgi:hypothetical protein
METKLNEAVSPAYPQVGPLAGDIAIAQVYAKKDILSPKE